MEATQCCFPLLLHSTACGYSSFPSVLLSSSSTHRISAPPPACSPSLVSSLPPHPPVHRSSKPHLPSCAYSLTPPLPLPAWYHLPLPPNTLHFHCLELFSSKSTQDPFQLGFVLCFRYLLQPIKAKNFYFFFQENTALGRPVHASHSKATKKAAKKVSPLHLTLQKRQPQTPFHNTVSYQEASENSSQRVTIFRICRNLGLSGLPKAGGDTHRSHTAEGTYVKLFQLGGQRSLCL